MVACDTLGSYGSMARFPDLNRILKVDIWNLEVLTSLSGQRHHNSGSWWRLRRFPIHRFVCLSVSLRWNIYLPRRRWRHQTEADWRGLQGWRVHDEAQGSSLVADQGHVQQKVRGGGYNGFLVSLRALDYITKISSWNIISTGKRPKFTKFPHLYTFCPVLNMMNFLKIWKWIILKCTYLRHY